MNNRSFGRMINPGLWWDDQVLVKRGRQVIATDGPQRASVFMSSANQSFLAPDYVSRLLRL